MKKHIFFLLVFLSFINLDAQIDTNRFYPLNTGDYWEYWGIFQDREYWMDIEVLGDKVMNNNKEYKIVRTTRTYVHNGHTYSSTEYQRVVRGTHVYQYDSLSVCDKEQLLYNFAARDSTFWKTCSSNIFYDTNRTYFNGVWYTLYHYHELFDWLLTTKCITNVVIWKNPNTGAVDTVWWPMIGIGQLWYTKGIGLLKFKNGPDEQYLQYAVINGTAYGTTGVKDHGERTRRDMKIKASAFPNPFNSSTVIRISDINNAAIDVRVYDIMGREIRKLYKGNVKDKVLNLKFEAGSLPSGTYIVLAQTSTSLITSKLLLIK